MNSEPQPALPAAPKYLRNALLVFVFGSLLYLAAKEFAAYRQAKSPAHSPLPAGAAPPKLIVYYFSQGKECVTCDRIEAFTREALDTHFADDLASGVIAFRAIDVDEPRHEHFITEYNIYTKSVVLVRMENGARVRWKNLESVWDLVYDKPAFIEYIRTQVRDYLLSSDPSGAS